jgi:hypothetical protein
LPESIKIQEETYEKKCLLPHTDACIHLPFFSACAQTPAPEITPDPGTPTDPGDCVIPCTANTVPPSLTTDPGEYPTPPPVLTPAPTRAPRVGDVTIGGAVIDEIKTTAHHALKDTSHKMPSPQEETTAQNS